MNLNLKNIAVALLTFTFLSCDSNDLSDTEENQSEPILLKHYYFEGKLDNEPFLIEKKIYDKFYSDDKPFNIDYGGTLINCSETTDNGVPSNCYTIYGSGIIIYESIHPSEIGKHNTAKAYFGRINVEKREFSSELEALREFLMNKDLKFRRDFGNPLQNGDFAFDFFPSGTNDTYYSTRFNDNSEFLAQITNIIEDSDNNFIEIEGIVEKCKLYDLKERDTYKLLTDFKFRIQINSGFNFNNYNDN
ncbi:hypothetical protein [uncultured Aquimarina sp.]|uniref:hypothetical protein n=1 Tax=uncultured Aquimarina sp. TaxID=575652 RepID=UPI0026103557|nr:hypothetical protein [uncultured Aquimarina sp.]